MSEVETDEAQWSASGEGPSPAAQWGGDAGALSTASLVKLPKMSHISNFNQTG